MSAGCKLVGVGRLRVQFFRTNALLFLGLGFSVQQADGVVTTSVFDTIEWTISGFSDLDFTRLPGTFISGNFEKVYYAADIPIGAMLDVEATVAVRQPEVLNIRQFDISLPNHGTRYITRLTADNLPPGAGIPDPFPETLDNRHKGFFHPYVREPAYPETRRVDKWIEIQSVGGSGGYDTMAQGEIAIYIIPRALLASSESGLPHYADFEPDEQVDSPYGCNGCADMGLPGFRVNMQTLGLIVQDTLFSYAGLGPRVTFQLSYNSGLGGVPTAFGNGWRLNLDQSLVRSYTGAIVQRGDGGSEQFGFQPTHEAWGVSPVGSSDDEVVITNGVVTVMPLGHFTFGRSKSGDTLSYTNADDAPPTWTLSRRGTRIREIYRRETNGPSSAFFLQAIDDWNGNTLQIQRNVNGSITQVVDSVQRITRFDLNESGFCTNIHLPHGRSMALAYDQDGNLTQCTDPAGIVTTYAYTESGILTNMATAGQPWGFTFTNYGGQVCITQIRDPDGHVAEYRSIYNEQSQSVDFSGRTFDYFSDGDKKNGNTRPGTMAISDYSDLGYPLRVTSPYVGMRGMAYDAEGRLILYSNAIGGVFSYAYASNGLVHTITNADGGVSTRTYDEWGNLARLVTPAGRVIDRTYDAQGRLITITDGNTNTTWFTYDAFGNLAMRVGPEGDVSTYHYDPYGIEQIGVTDPNGHTTSRTYDGNRRLTGLTFPDGTSVELTYDCCAQTGFRDERGNWRFIQRDARLNPLVESDYTGAAHTNTYDGEGRLLTRTDAKGHQVALTYDAQGRPETITGPRGNITTRTYPSSWETVLQPTQLAYQDAGGFWSPTDVNYSYQGEGLFTQADGSFRGYDPMNRLVRKLTPGFNFVYYRYDPDGLLTAKLYGAQALYERSFDGAGQVSKVSHGLGEDWYTYDGNGRLTGALYAKGQSLAMAYDPAGNLTNMMYPGGLQVAYTYDVRNRPVQVAWGDHAMHIQYDAAGVPTNEWRSNESESAYTYNANHAMSHYRHVQTGRVLVAVNVFRDAIGQVTARTQTAGVTLMSPPLTAGQSTQTHTPVFQLRTLDGEVATVDGNRNLTFLPGPDGFTATYDPEGHPRMILYHGYTNTFVYGDQAKPIQHSRNGEARTLHYDRADRLLFVCGKDGSVIQRYVYLGAIPIAIVQGDHVFWYHYDQQGNTQFLTDEAGRIAAVYSYSPYGRSSGSYSRVENLFTFAGRFGVQEVGNGLYVMGHRLYSATLGRFASPDPLGYGVGINPLVYAHNNPVGFVDPGGLVARSADYYNRGYQRDERQQHLTFMPPVVSRTRINFDLKGCYLTAESIFSTLSSSFGKFKAMRELFNGEFVPATLDTLGLGLTKLGGTFFGFMQVETAAGETDEEIQRAREQMEQEHNRKRRNDYFNTFDSGGYQGFTIDEPTFPPFTLGD